MNAFWDFYWPLLTGAVVIGVLTGWMGFRAKGARQPRTSEFRRHAALVAVAGAIAVLVFGALWHGPLGTGHRFATSIEQESRRVLVDWEMPQIQAQLEHRPLKRTLVLAGPADDFQRSELIRIMDGVPGVANVRWADMRSPLRLPLVAEAELAGLLCFSLGLLLSYLLELRRRYRAQWSW
jgi:hypothetical protein